MESLVSFTTSRRVVASLLPEVWQRAEAHLAKGSQERCHLYLKTVNKVIRGNADDSEPLAMLILTFKGWI